jgi:hypothetical protein
MGRVIVHSLTGAVTCSIRHIANLLPIVAGPVGGGFSPDGEKQKGWVWGQGWAYPNLSFLGLDKLIEILLEKYRTSFDDLKDHFKRYEAHVEHIV